MYGETEEELLANAKRHGIEVHGGTPKKHGMKGYLQQQKLQRYNFYIIR